VRIPRTIALLTVSITLLLAAVGGSLSSNIKVYPYLSCSPLNPGPGGTSSFYSDIAKKRIVYLGNVSFLEKQNIRGKVLYMLVGIDTPISEKEASILSRMVKEGKANLIVADETNNTNRLLEKLGLPKIKSIVLNETGNNDGGWVYIVRVYCGQESFYTSLAARVEPGVGGRILCRYSDGTPSAVLYIINGSRVLVIGDSSMFSNFIYERGFGGFPVSQQVVWHVLEKSGVLENVSVVVFDTAHYSYETGKGSLFFFTGIARSTSDSLQNLRERLASSSDPYLILVFLAATMPWPLILLHPITPPPGKPEVLVEHENELIDTMVSRLGLEEGEGLDSILREAGRRVKNGG
jgi:hypothetical protein